MIEPWQGAAVKRLTLAFAVAITALTCDAKAADLRPAVTAPLAPVGAAYDWSGFYAGVHAGGSWADNRFFDVNGGVDSAVFTAAGVFGGGQIGFNWQTGRWVLGAELEGSLSHLQRGVFGPFCGFGFGGLGCGGIPGLPPGCSPLGPCQCSPLGIQSFGCAGQLGARVQAIGIASGRVGHAWDRWLVYLKAGGAVADEKYVFNSIGILAATPTETRFGWMVGGGVEYGLDANWSVKLEYDYIDLGATRLALLSPAGLTFVFDQDQQVHLAKVGLNYRFAGGRP